MRMLPDLPEVDALRHTLHDTVFVRRKGALLNVCDGMLCTTSRCRCLAHTSVPTDLGHGGMYAALDRGSINEQALLKTLHTATPGVRLYALDHTNVPRPRARTSPRRKRLHQGGGRRRGHETRIGWSLSVLARLTLESDSWAVPLSVREVRPGEDLIQGTMVQLRQLVKHSGATSTDPDVVLLDAGFPAAKLTKAVRDEGLPIVLVVRLATSQVFYTDPGTYRGRGRPRLHGERVGISSTEVPPSDEVSYPDPVFGVCRIRGWRNVHPLTPQFGIITGTVLRVDVTHLRRGMRRSMLGLWCSSDQTPVPLVELLLWYLRRFDIEHLFRLWKHHLGLTEYHPVHPEQLVRWVQCMMVTTVEAYLSRDRLTDVPHPWERPTRTLSPAQVLSPVRALRALSQAVHTLWAPTPVVRKPTPGPRTPRGRAKRKRPTYKIWRPGDDPTLSGS